MAVTLTVAQLAEVISGDAARLLPVVQAVVQDYAPKAPEALQNEAAIRFASYLADAGSGASSRIEIGELTVERVTNHAPAFRNCGAAALLTRYRVRRAGAI